MPQISKDFGLRRIDQLLHKKNVVEKWGPHSRCLYRGSAWRSYGPASYVFCYVFQGRAQKFEKGGPQFSVFVSAKNIGQDQKKGLHVFGRPIYSPKSSEDQIKKGLLVFRRSIYPPKSSDNPPRKTGRCVLRCPVSTVLLTGDIYQLMFQRKRGGDPLFQ